MNEIWKDIPNYEGHYQVSSIGRIKSLSRNLLKNGKYPYISKEKILKCSSKKGGYIQVSLNINTELKCFGVHQLVAMAFLNHIINGHTMVVDHINDVRTDNRVENLQIISQRENAYKTQGKYSSKYKGVAWHKRGCNWSAYIWNGNKLINLGSFSNEYDAHLAYQKALSEYK